MTTNLTSNWMGNRNASPTIYRASSKGKIFTRRERERLVENERIQTAKRANHKELILLEKAKIRAEKEARAKFFEGVKTLANNPDAKIKHGKGGLYIQPRVNGSFGPKITL